MRVISTGGYDFRIEPQGNGTFSVTRHPMKVGQNTLQFVASIEDVSFGAPKCVTDLDDIGVGWMLTLVPQEGDPLQIRVKTLPDKQKKPIR